MYEQQMFELQQGHQQPAMAKIRSSDQTNEGGIEEERLEKVDLSGMSLESLPNPSLNLAIICKLDLSNNNLQVHTFISITIIKTCSSLLVFMILNCNREKNVIVVKIELHIDYNYQFKTTLLLYRYFFPLFCHGI